MGRYQKYIERMTQSRQPKRQKYRQLSIEKQPKQITPSGIEQKWLEKAV